MAQTSSNREEGPLIGALLRGCWQLVRARVHRDLVTSGFGDIGSAHLAVLQYPSPRGVRVTALAERAQMSRQAINYLIRELEEKGYVERRPDPSDGRARVIHLTRRGEAAIRSIRASVRRLEREWEQEIGRGRFTQLRETLLDLASVSHEP